MCRNFRKIFVGLVAMFIAFGMLVPAAYSAEKIGYVDLRRAFYDYERTKTFEEELNALTEERQSARTKKIEVITKMRDEAELLKDKAKQQKQAEIDAKINELQEFDRETRQQLLNKKNDMFRQVIDDIQKVVEDLGKKDNYDYILDSRNIMYGKEEFDLTDQVVTRLNKK